MSSGAFEISDTQEDDTEAALTRRPDSINVTFVRKLLNVVFGMHRKWRNTLRVVECKSWIRAVSRRAPSMAPTPNLRNASNFSATTISAQWFSSACAQALCRERLRDLGREVAARQAAADVQTGL
jgi:hypothetical protein